MDLDSRLGRCEVTAVPHGPLRLVWVRPEPVDEPVQRHDAAHVASAVLASLDAYRITRIPERAAS
jgi:hypothetical protein